eukprot:1268501-Rhodomonas_salina.1
MSPSLSVTKLSNVACRLINSWSVCARHRAAFVSHSEVKSLARELYLSVGWNSQQFAGGAPTWHYDGLGRDFGFFLGTWGEN